MLKGQFFNIVREPQLIESTQLTELEQIVQEYPFFESAHLLYTKGLSTSNALNYSRQLRKTAVVANSRAVLYELLHPKQILTTAPAIVVESKQPEPLFLEEKVEQVAEEPAPKINRVTITDNDIKVVYINTVPTIVPTPIEAKVEKEVIQSVKEEIEIVQAIENETEVPANDFNKARLNKTLDDEINRGIIQSYVETDIIKTPGLHVEEIKEPISFTDWLKTIQKESHTFQVETKNDLPVEPETKQKTNKPPEITPKSTVFNQKKQLIDKIIESDPGRIKLGSTKFFTPVSDAKQSLLENEHLVTETLAKIYALQGNVSKAIRAYEILSLKFPQKSVYFASLIEKLKTK